MFFIPLLYVEEIFSAFGYKFTLFTQALMDVLLVPILGRVQALLCLQHDVVDSMLPHAFEVTLYNGK